MPAALAFSPVPIDREAMKIAVVTGAGRGLGRLTAERIARRGFKVLVTDIDARAAEETARGLGGSAFAIAQDVRDPGSHQRVADAASAEGPLALWVNNAGVLRAAAAWEHSDEDVRLQIEVNVLGVMWGSRAAVAAMKRSGGGHIINLASMSSLTPTPGLAVYGASKQAVLGFSLSLQGDLNHAHVPIHVSAICPDAIDTDMVRDVAGEKGSALLFTSSQLLRPEKVADLIGELVDQPRLVLTYPRRRAALARVLAPFPELGLKLLEQYRRLGERNRRRTQAG
jgi:NAD(P)-dependent dehydrogenase (short-subunit alcohol dehydrogenase family)